MLRRCRFAAACLVLLLSAGHAAVPAAPLSLAAYRAQLADWQRSLVALRSPTQARMLAVRAPAIWEVQRGASKVAVPAAWLARDLQQIAAGKLSLREGRLQLSARLAALAVAASASPMPAATLAAQRQTLQSILARREFASVRGPTFSEEVTAAIQEAFSWLFGRLSPKGNTAPFAWGLLLLLFVAVVAVLITVLRRLVRAPNALRLGQLVSANPPWRDWLRQARALAAGGDGLMFAVCIYQAGVGFGEAAGWWHNEATATPREYLRSLPAQHPARAPWQSLVKQFEALRYAGVEPGVAARTRLLSVLEDLGCR